MTHDDLHIRPATADDWPSLWPIMRDVFARGDTYNHTEHTSEEDARAYWMGKGLSPYVAVRGGEIVGTYTLRTNQPGRGSHVANAGFMVRGDQSGRGVGFAMGEHALNTARAAGYTAMQFNFVVSTNTRAVELWKRLGFAVVGTAPGAYRHRELGDVDVFIMHRML